jgi:O-antigen ligase
MPAAETGQASTGLSGPVAFGAGLLLLGLAPIIRGGNRHVALILLEWLALLLLLALLARGLAFKDRADAQPIPPLASAGVWMLALSPLWVALVQLIPLPATLWAALPGHAPYVEALAVAQVPAAGYRPLSLTPDITRVSVLAGLPLSAAFLLAFYSSFRQIGLLVRALVGLAVAQAVLGLLQMGPFPGLSFGSAIGGRAIGTFANPNHFASYIAMTLPLAILLLRQATVSARGATRGQARGGRPAGALWGVAMFLLLSAVLASGSRGGTVTCLVVTLLAVALLPQGSGHRPERRHWGMAGMAGLLALVALAVGVDALLARFEGDKTGYLAGDRWAYVTSTWQAALAFWPFGTGLGSYASVFPAFHPPGVRGFIEHAHNDYVQLLMECGLLAVVLAILAPALIIRQVVALVRQAHRTGLDAAGLLQASCGLGLLAVLLHSWVEFNLRIPANAMLATFLLGVLLRPLRAQPGQPARESVSR